MRGMSPRVVPAERTPQPALRATFSHKGRREEAKHLIPGLERALGAAAGLFPDLGRIDRAGQLDETFGCRSGCTLGRNASHGFGREDLAGAASGDGLLRAFEGQFAGARGNVDIAHAATDLVRSDRNLLGISPANL